MAAVDAVPEGWESVLVWPMLVVGGGSSEGDGFRGWFEKRMERRRGRGEVGGGLERAECVLGELWEGERRGERGGWREAMGRVGGGEWLLI